MAKRKFRGPWNPLKSTYHNSRKVNSLSIGAETMYTRLIAASDDGSNYHGRPGLILCHLFARRWDAGEVVLEDVKKWKKEIVDVGLALIYMVDDEEYLHLIDCLKFQRSDTPPKFEYPQYTGQEPEPEEGEQLETPPASPPKGEDFGEKGLTPIPMKEAYKDYWNSKDTLPPIRTMNKSRSDKLKIRMEEPVFRDNWRSIIDRLSESEFHTGGGSRGWKATVDWILKNDTNYLKILELPTRGEQVNQALGVRRPTETEADVLLKECV